MRINSVRSNEIKAYIENNPQSKLGEIPFEISGTVENRAYYKIPIKLLRYSIENGRFAAEKLALESDLGRSLDPERPEDVQEIKKMLLQVDPEATQKLIQDVLEKEQIFPGVVTADGYVKNGNRRMAIIQSIHDDHPSPKWEFLKTIVLPESVSEADLWRIEAGLQLSQETKLDYGPINELLKLKEGKESGLSEREMAAAMYGWTEDKIREALERLDLIEQYLSFWGKTRYKAVENAHEYFINLQNLIKGWKNDGVSNLEINERIERVFMYIENVNIPERRTSHMDIRSMRDIFAIDKARTAFMNRTSERVVKRHTGKSSPELAYEAFQDAKEIVDIEKEHSQPQVLLSRAIRLLEGIRDAADSNGHFSTEQNISLLRKVKALLEKILEKVPLDEAKRNS